MWLKKRGFSYNVSILITLALTFVLGLGLLAIMVMATSGTRSTTWASPAISRSITRTAHMLRQAQNVPLTKRMEIEHVFFPIVDGGNIFHIWLGEARPDPHGLMDMAMNLCKNTQIRVLRVHPGSHSLAPPVPRVQARPKNNRPAVEIRHPGPGLILFSCPPVPAKQDRKKEKWLPVIRRNLPERDIHHAAVDPVSAVDHIDPLFERDRGERVINADLDFFRLDIGIRRVLGLGRDRCRNEDLRLGLLHLVRDVVPAVLGSAIIDFGVPRWRCGSQSYTR